MKLWSWIRENRCEDLTYPFFSINPFKPVKPASSSSTSIPLSKRYTFGCLNPAQNLKILSENIGFIFAFARVKRNPIGPERVSVPWQKMQWIAREPQVASRPFSGISFALTK